MLYDSLAAYNKTFSFKCFVHQSTSNRFWKAERWNLIFIPTIDGFRWCGFSRLRFFPHVKYAREANARQLNQIKAKSCFLNSLSLNSSELPNELSVQEKRVMNADRGPEKQQLKWFFSSFLSECDFKIGENVQWVCEWHIRVELEALLLSISWSVNIFVRQWLNLLLCTTTIISDGRV